jgi:hypothetical protein
MITCENCGFENPADAPICARCGVELEGRPQPVHCPKCGLPNLPGSETCQHCGARMRPATSPRQEPASDLPIVPDFSATLPRTPGTDDLEKPEESPAEQTTIAKSGKKPTEPFYGTQVERAEGFGEEEPPPDFRIGPVPDEEEQDVDTIDVEAIGLMDRLAGFGEPTAEDREAPKQSRGDDQPPTPPGAPPAQPSDKETPDWLQTLTADQPAPQPTVQPSEEAPDWLRSIAADQPAPPPTVQPPEELPDWLRAVGAEPSAPPTQPVEAVEEGEPDWLQAATVEQPAPPTQPVEAAEEEEPDWLQAATVEQPAPPTQPAEAVEEKPEWLKGVAEPPRVEAMPQEEEEELPHWMRDTPPPGPAPEWLERVAEPPKPAPAQPSDEEEEPEWIAELLQEEPPPGAEPQPPAQPGMAAAPEEEKPEWLGILDTSPGSPPPPPAEPGPPAPPPAFDIEALSEDTEGEEDMPDWLRAMQPEGMDLLETPPDAGDSLPFVGSPLFDWMQVEVGEEEAPADEQEVDLGSADLPAWMRNLRPTEEGGVVAEIVPTARRGLFSGPLPAEMESLRAKEIAGGLEAEQEERVETSGPLSGLRGSLGAEPIFVTPSAPEMVRQVVVSDDQRRQVAILEELLAAEPEGVSVSGVRKLALPVDRWAVYLILLVAMVLPIVVGLNLFPVPPARTRAANDARLAIEALPTDARVLVAFEYEPDAAGELDASAEAILHHLMTRGATIYALSSKPTGPTIAQSVLERVGAEYDYTYGDDWINLGYVSGGAQGLNGLLLGTPSGAPSPLDRDFRGESTDLGSARLTAMNLDMIVVLAARPEDVRVWVEQIGQPSGIPMMAAVSASGAPLVYPYWAQGRQLQGVVAGLIDSTAYTADLHSGQLPASLHGRWDGLAFGSIAAAGAIAVGGVLAGVSTWRRRQGTS